MFHCNIKNCNRKPYMEMYDTINNTWCFVCLWHYIYYRIKRKSHLGFAKLDNPMSLIYEIEDQITNILYELEEIKIIICDELKIPVCKYCKEIFKSEEDLKSHHKECESKKLYSLIEE
jgi:hypothetical protein